MEKIFFNNEKSNIYILGKIKYGQGQYQGVHHRDVSHAVPTPNFFRINKFYLKYIEYIF